jgi:hypothetical protein
VPRLAEPPSLSPADLQGYAGKYWSDELQVTYSVEVVSGKVLVNKPGATGVELKLFAPDLFAAPAVSAVDGAWRLRDVKWRSVCDDLLLSGTVVRKGD